MVERDDTRGEEMFLAKVGKGYRITIHEPAREVLGIEIGDLLRVTVRIVRNQKVKE